jgi:hypothetical protein
VRALRAQLGCRLEIAAQDRHTRGEWWTLSFGRHFLRHTRLPDGFWISVTNRIAQSWVCREDARRRQDDFPLFLQVDLGEGVWCFLGLVVRRTGSRTIGGRGSLLVPGERTCVGAARPGVQVLLCCGLARVSVGPRGTGPFSFVQERTSILSSLSLSLSLVSVGARRRDCAECGRRGGNQGRGPGRYLLKGGTGGNGGDGTLGLGQDGTGVKARESKEKCWTTVLGGACALHHGQDWRGRVGCGLNPAANRGPSLLTAL